MLARRATPGGHDTGHRTRDGDDAAPVPPCLGGDDDRHDVPYRGADDRDVWDRRGGEAAAGGALRPDVGVCECLPLGLDWLRRDSLRCRRRPRGSGDAVDVADGQCGAARRRRAPAGRRLPTVPAQEPLSDKVPEPAELPPHIVARWVRRRLRYGPEARRLLPGLLLAAFRDPLSAWRNENRGYGFLDATHLCREIAPMGLVDRERCRRRACGLRRRRARNGARSPRNRISRLLHRLALVQEDSYVDAKSSDPDR